MKKYSLAVSVMAVFLTVGSAAAQRPDTASTVTVIEGATVIDVVSGQPIRDAVIVIEGTTIRGVGRRGSVPVPANAQRINAAGKTIIPGIFCVHGHLAQTEGMERKQEFYNRQRIQRDANAYLYYGVTHMVSLGIDLEPMQGFLADQRAGKAGGARLYSGGLGFAAKDGWQPGGYQGIHRPTTVAEAREMVRKEIAGKKPDVLKVWVDDGNGQLPKLSPELYGAIIDEGHKQNVRVFAHTVKLEDAKELIRRGIDALAHSVRDQEVDAEFLKLAQDKGVTQMATMAGMEGILAYAAGATFLNDPGLPVLFPAAALRTLGSKQYQEQMAKDPNLAATRNQYQLALKNTAKIAAAGIPLALGTDSGAPGRFQGFWEHREMELLVRAGLTPMQAIQVATINGARLFRVDKQYGSLQAGKVADLIVLNADPLADITNSRKIDSVWMNGKRVDRAALGTYGAGSNGEVFNIRQASPGR
ncbi:MAG: hypothetical protein A3H28_11705 [Acidobacteria bacterium RIFCSPLOWO2_02_FULL_61_28]|nr:MAG: hypothetical protein A3H28_11705 [Acidobacteria bacterium RIFCSPLOWO2_02_FULL_61_28]